MDDVLLGMRETRLKKLREFKKSFRTLIICLCLGSLIIFCPWRTGMGLSISEGYEIDFENHSQFEQTDYDEEFLVGSFANPTLAGLLSSNSRSAHLHSRLLLYHPTLPLPNSKNSIDALCMHTTTPCGGCVLLLHLKSGPSNYFQARTVPTDLVITSQSRWHAIFGVNMDFLKGFFIGDRKRRKNSDLGAFRSS